MKNELNRDLLRDSLDKIGLLTSIDNDGDLRTVLSADEDFGHDVVIYYLIREGWLGVHAFAKNLNLKMTEQEALKFVNEFNCSTKLPKAYIKNGDLYLEHWIVIESNFSKEFLRKSLQNLTGYVWHAFCDMKL